MKRTTIFLEPDLEILLKLEARREKKPVAQVIREALRNHLQERPAKMPPGAGAFDSGRTDTAERAEDLLNKTGFGEDE